MPVFDGKNNTEPFSHLHTNFPDEETVKRLWLRNKGRNKDIQKERRGGNQHKKGISERRILAYSLEVN